MQIDVLSDDRKTTTPVSPAHPMPITPHLADGDGVAIPADDSYTRTIAYNADGTINTVTFTDGLGTWVKTYSYDASGRVSSITPYTNVGLDYISASPVPAYHNGDTFALGGSNWVVQNHSDSGNTSYWAVLKSPHAPVYRFEIHEDDEWSGDIGAVPAKERSEVGVTGVKETLGVTYSCSWQLRFGCPGWNGVDSLRAIVGQLHPAGAYLPNWAMEVQPTGKLALKVAYDVSVGVNNVTQTTVYTSAASIADGAWHNIQVVWMNSADTLHGTLALYLDGVLVYNNADIAMGFLHDTAGPYLKFGLYRQTHSNPLIAEYANPEHVAGDLSARATAPLPIPTGASTPIPAR